MSTTVERRTERRNQVHQLAADGMSARMIARELGIDHKTVTADLKVGNSKFPTPSKRSAAPDNSFNPTPTLADYKYSNYCWQRAHWDYGIDPNDFPQLWTEYLTTQNTDRTDTHLGHERRFLTWMKNTHHHEDAA